MDRQWKLAGWGCFFFLLGVFLLFHPGRIDMLDGQYRFDVTRNILDLHSPKLTDPNLTQWPAPRNSKTGVAYSYYTAPASLLPIPLIEVSRVLGGSNAAADRFSFSLTSAFVGALIAPLLLMLYRRLGVALRVAMACTMAFSVATLWWPASETVFDQCQHGVVLLGMIVAAFDAVEGQRWHRALLAGLLGGLLLNYRVPFFLLLPFVPLYWRAELRNRKGGSGDLLPLTAAFVAGIAIGISGYIFYNWIRFGQFSMPPYLATAPAIGNPIFGFLTLMVSPGKGVLWYSPPLILGVLGMAKMIKFARPLAVLIISMTVMHIAEMSCLTFAGGDWCWGTRYMVPILPLWAIAFPYLPPKALPKFATYSIVAIGVLVQSLGNSLDIHRFYFFRRLGPNFWLDPIAYFQRSQLAARPAEIVESISDRNIVRPYAISSPTREATYCPFGPPDNVDPQVWVRQFRIFYLPRPWWGWINHVPKEQRPVDPQLFLIVCLMTTGIGTGVIRRSLSPSEVKS